MISEGLKMKLIGLFMLLMSVAFGFGAYYSGLEMKALTENGVIATGTVIDIVREEDWDTHDDRRQILYHSVVSFKDERGQTHRFDDNLSASSPPHEMDEKLQVLYILDDPETVIVDRGMFMNWLASVIFGVGALVLLVAGLIAFLKGRNQGVYY